MSVQVDLEAGHELDLIVALNVVRVLGAPRRDLLPAIAFEDVECERVVAVEYVSAVLPDELCGNTIGFGRVGLVEIKGLLPEAIVGETVGLAGGLWIDERVVGGIVKVESCQDVSCAGRPCAL